MITIPLWMRAVDVQLEAIAFTDVFTATFAGKVSNKDFLNLRHHYGAVKEARPFGWSTDSITSVLEASTSIPDDTLLNRHNLSDMTVFWWFEQPLCVPYRRHSIVQALVGKWERDVFIVTLWYQTDKGITPGHFWFWRENEALSNPIEQNRLDLAQEKYQAWTDDPQGQIEQAAQATRIVGKFILAAFAWLDQKILVVTEENGERHARKRYQKVTKHWHPVSIVQLRKREYQRVDGSVGESSNASPSYRFVVNGHWRNQPCGPAHSDKKLIYIMPFIKGPEEAPFRPKLKVYEVTR